ncbi:MAG TPA: 5'-nucleotidase [Prevotella sp.]|nr:5'-nucleotidase [uncultured Prevotella sp.]HRM56723.1 5'-nucleotidase [Prevotella sp.]
MRNRQKTFLALASATFLLIANPCAAQKYKVAKVERTRILIDKQWDAQPDAEAAAFIAPYKNKVDSIMGPVVGTLSHDMTRHRPESELSNLLTDILVWGGRDFHEQPVFAVYNMGGIRSNLAKGKVTVGDVNDMAPFENKICFLTLTGEKVTELFQQIAHRGGEGLSHAVRLVITKDGHLKSATINGEPVAPQKQYRIATLDYLAEGNDQLVAFKSGTDVVAPKAKENNVRYIIMSYFREKMAKGESVESQVEGRVVVD